MSYQSGVTSSTPRIANNDSFLQYLQKSCSKTIDTEIPVIGVPCIYRQLAYQFRFANETFDGGGKTSGVSRFHKQRVLFRNEVLTYHSYLGAQDSFAQRHCFDQGQGTGFVRRGAKHHVGFLNKSKCIVMRDCFSETNVR